MSVHIDPSQWRLHTTGGIPYKLMEGYPKGNFGDGTSVQEKLIIRSSDLMDFVTESFPSMVSWAPDKFNYSPGRQCPSIAGLFTKTVNFEAIDGTRPLDPMGVDDNAPSGTYGEFLHLTVDYGVSNDGGSGGEADPNDPTTFLEITASAAGRTMPFEQDKDGNLQWLDESAGTYSAITEDIPNDKLEPLIAWTVKFPRASQSVAGLIINHSRAYLGKVNSSMMPVLLGAPYGTILYQSFAVSQQFIWQDGWTIPFTVEFHFLEKHIEQDSVVLGHQYFWNKDAHKYQLIIRRDAPDTDNKMYRYAELNALWGT